MLTSRFEGLLGDLFGKFHVYHDAPRDPERVVELAAARAGVEDVRSEIFEEGKATLRALRKLRIEDPDAYRLMLSKQIVVRAPN